MELTAEIARELLTYNPDTGKLLWKERPVKYFKNQNPSYAKRWNNRWVGKEAFTSINRNKKSNHRRLQGRVLSKRYYAHRITWLIYYGEWPKNQIDHINQDATDNRIKNLRDVTNAENNKNKTLQNNNKTGYLGVSKRHGKYRAEINVNNIRKHLGYYDTVEEAAAARAVANINYNYHPNHGKEKKEHR